MKVRRVSKQLFDTRVPIASYAVAYAVATWMFMSGCTRSNPAVCCETVEQCQDIGVSDFRPCSDGLVCIRNECEERVADASIDAFVSDAGTHVFDVAYPEEWKFSVSGPISGYLLIVNAKGTALDTSTLEVRSISDDHPTAIVRVTANPVIATIATARAGGFVTPFSKTLLVDSGMVPEARVETNSDYLTLEIQDAPPGTYDINVNLVIGLDNIAIPLPMKIHMVPGPSVYADPTVGKRVLVFH